MFIYIYTVNKNLKDVIYLLKKRTLKRSINKTVKVICVVYRFVARLPL